MNPSTLIGMIASVLLMAVIVLFAADNPWVFIDGPSIAIVLGGVIALFGAPVTAAQGELAADAGSFGLRQARAGVAAPLGSGRCGIVVWRMPTTSVIPPTRNCAMDTEWLRMSLVTP